MNAERVTTTARLDEIGFYAWPGGYAVYYLDAENGDDLCPTCARRELAEWEEICAVWDSAGEVHDLTIRPEFYLQTSDWSDDAVSGRGLMCGDCSGWIVPPDEETQDDDPLCVCGVARSEHALCGCEQFEKGA